MANRFIAVTKLHPSGLDDQPGMLAGGVLRDNLCAKVPESVIEEDIVVGLIAYESYIGDQPAVYWSPEIRE